MPHPCRCAAGALCALQPASSAARGVMWRRVCVWHGVWGGVGRLGRVAAIVAVASPHRSCSWIRRSPRPSQCVHQVPAGSHIEPVEGGVWVHAPDGTNTWLPELPECVEDMRARAAVRKAGLAMRNTTMFNAALKVRGAVVCLCVTEWAGHSWPRLGGPGGAWYVCVGVLASRFRLLSPLLRLA